MTKSNRPINRLPRHFGRIALLHAAFAASLAHAQPLWSDDFVSGDIAFGDTSGPPDDLVRALAVLEPAGAEGPGAALFLGGRFATAGGLPATGIACYQDGSWRDVTAGFLVPFATAAVTNDIVLFDSDGAGPFPAQVYAAVTLHRGSSDDHHRVVRWNGAAWEQVGPLFSNEIYALAVFDADGKGPAPAELIAGGAFATIGSEPRPYLARWNGASWLAMPTSVDGAVHALHAHDDDGEGPGPAALYAGGTFAHAGGISSPCIARWSGENWTPLGTGLVAANFPAAYALHSFDFDGSGDEPAALVVGGNFTTAGGVSANRIARWNGTNFAAIGLGSSGAVLALATHDTDGTGPQPPSLCRGASGAGISRWTGQQWVNVGSGINGSVYVLEAFDEDGTAGPEQPLLIAGGLFGATPHTPTGSAHLPLLARWDGLLWAPLGSSFNHTVYGLASYDRDGDGPSTPLLYAAGEFTRIDGRAATSLATYDGASWAPVTPGLALNVIGMRPVGVTMLPFDEDGSGPLPPLLVLGGRFTSAGGVAANRIARFDGTAWSAFGPGLGGASNFNTVAWLVSWDLDSSGPAPARLVAAGDFLHSGTDLTVRYLAMWTGEAWTSLGGLDAEVRGLAVFDQDGAGPAPNCLVVARFTSGPAQVARFDGQTWQDIGAGLAQAVSSLAVFDADGSGPALAELYAGCLASPSAASIQRWDGQSWQATDTSSLDPVLFASVKLVVHDEDGPGGAAPALYAAGRSPNGTGPFALARLNGGQWLPVTNGDRSEVHSLASFDADGPGGRLPALFLGGNFAAISGVSAGRIAALTMTPPVACAADWNRDDAFNSNDISDYLTAWLADIQNGTALANFNGDGGTNSNDISAFLTAWLDAVQGAC